MTYSVANLGCRSLMFCLGLLCVSPVRAERPLGTDVSGYQPNVNWTAVKNGGLTFAWTKATQGTGYVNPYFVSQENGAKAAGIYIGAYHYATPSVDTNITGANSADSEAAHFWGTASNYVKYGGAYLVPMLDWEDPDVTASQFTAAKLTAWANEWCNQVARYALTNGVILRPVIYTGSWYSNPANGYPGLTTAITNWPSWFSVYPTNANPQTGSPVGYTYPWPSWNIWQYSDTNIYSAGDSDAYNGTLAGFVQNFVVGGTNAPVIANPTNLSVALGGSATFSAGVSGTLPLHVQWQFNGTAIPGATSTNYTIASVQLTDAGGYSVVVTNSFARVTSSPAFLAVSAPLTNATGSILAPPGMVNWWTADGNASDIAGTNNATPYNGFSYVTGKKGLAFHFDGSTSYLLVSGGVTNPPNWTACLWVNRQTAPGASAALMGDATYALKLEQYPGIHEVGFTKSGVADYLFSPAYTAPSGVWTHLAFVGTSSGVTLYTNGVLEGTITATGLALPRACIGADLLSGSATDYMLGGLDEVQVFSAALNAVQVKSIYAAGSAGLVGAPQFTGLSRSAGGQIQLQMKGLTGKAFTLYSSTNLITWTVLEVVANPVGATQYLDSATSPEKFYQAVQP
jgi:GH25 family lysozyme M1 (1,4-beta-N-acetylmuramidase)